MSQVIRPRFGQPCFQCANPVSTARVQTLREHVQARGRAFLKSDVLCPDCKREADERDRGVDVTRPMHR